MRHPQMRHPQMRHPQMRNNAKGGILMKRIFLSALSLMLIFILIIPMQSCKTQSEPPELDEVRERLIYLIEESKELNVLFFGNGLPVYRRESDISERKMVYFTDTYGRFDRIMENSEFQSPEAIKLKAEQVYSADYASDIYESAFDGIMTGSSSAYIRFYDNSGSFLQNTDATVFKIKERIYDYSSMKIIEPSTADYINLEINSYTVSDPTIRKIYLSFVYENNNWYLDSPSY